MADGDRERKREKKGEGRSLEGLVTGLLKLKHPSILKIRGNETR